MVIKRVRIENFKRLRGLDIELKRFDCVVGPNNSGKTTLLQALALFDFCVHECLTSRNGVLELKNRSIAFEEFYVLPVSDPMDLWTDGRTQDASKHIKIRIEATFDDDREVTAAVDLSFNRFQLSVSCDETDQAWLARLRDTRFAYLPVFSMFLPREERRTPAVIEDELARGRVNAVVRNLLLDLRRDEQGYRQLEEVLRRVFPALRGLKIDFDEANDRYITVTYTEEGHARSFDLFSAGSGLQQFVYLFGFIFLRKPTTILLDEPDVHLHGLLQRALLTELKRLVEQGRQVLFATHSRELLTRVCPSNLLYLGDDGPKRLSVAFDVYDTLDRLGSVDPTQLPLAQAYRRVLVVENQADRDLLSTFCSLVLGPSQWQEVERRLCFCYTFGNPWKQGDMRRLQKQLSQVVAVAGQPIRLFVVADRDYHPDRAYLLNNLSSEFIEWHVWERTEIENYLLCWEGLRRLVFHPLASGPLFAAAEEEEEGAFRAELERLLESSRESANDQLVKAFQGYGRALDKPWDAATLSKKAREYLREHWEQDKLGLADAKETVLPGLKRWLQQRGRPQFSNQALAEALHIEDLPAEIGELAKRLAKFAGVT